MAKPEHSIVVDNYAEFRDDIRAFAAGKYNFLFVIGKTGLGKTQTVQQIVGNCCIFDGQPSAWRLYCELFDSRHATVVLDDVSAKFYRDPNCQSLLKALTNTRPNKTLRWTTASAGPDKPYPAEFETTSRVILLTNQWETMNEHIRAIEGRAFIIVFDPTPEEVHFEVGRSGWFHDQEVYDFIWNHRRFITRPDMRVYGRIAEQKAAGRPWNKRALEMLIGDKRLQQIAELLQDPQFTSNNQRVQEFIRLGYSRSTFYSLLKEFRWYNRIDPSQTPPQLDEVDRESTEPAGEARLSDTCENPTELSGLQECQLLGTHESPYAGETSPSPPAGS